MNHPQVYKCPLPPESPAISLLKALFRLSQNTGLSSLFYTENSHLLSILHMVMYMFPCSSLNSSHSLCSHKIKRCLLLGRRVMTNLVQFSSVVQTCLTLCDPMECSMPGFPVLSHLLELFRLMSIESMMPSNHLILCHPLLLLPSIFSSIRVFSSESALLIR